MEVGNVEEAQVGNLEETLREGAPPHLKTLFFTPQPVKKFGQLGLFIFYSLAHSGSGEPGYGPIGVELRIYHGGPYMLYMRG